MSENRLSAPRRESPTSGDADAPAVASYIADMTAQLESMATAAGLDLLAYFLAMARAESEAASRVDAGAAGEDAPVRLKRPIVVDGGDARCRARPKRDGRRWLDVGACRRDDAAARPISPDALIPFLRS